MTTSRNRDYAYWDWEREYNLNPHPYLARIPSGFEHLIINVRDVKEYTIRAGVNRDNVLSNYHDWMETIITALRILMQENPRFEQARITTSYYLLRYSATQIFDTSLLYLSLYERISRIKEISSWGYSRSQENIFEITDGVNTVKTEPVHVRMQVYKIEKHEMDEKYPHTCFLCGKALQYIHAKGQGMREGMDKESFDKLWESGNVEFYCCSCYRQMTKPNPSETQENDSRNTANLNRRDYICW